MTSELTVAIHAAVYLAHKTHRSPATNWQSTSALIPSASARLWLLCRAGIAVSQEGSEGGYRLCRSPQAITLRQIAEALNVALVESKWQSGDPEMSCLVASGMAREMDKIYRSLNEQCLESLDRLTLWDLLQDLFISQPENIIMKKGGTHS
ncbi:MAG: Rrf2 family transcriptional regulator [Holdemania filiformis]